VNEKTVELLIVIAFGAIFGYLVIDNILVRIKNRFLVSKITQAEIDLITTMSNMKEILQREAEKSESNDGFLKFVSDSRDWAFSYIEEAQAAVQQFKNSVEAIIVSYQVDSTVPLTDKEMKQIADAYNELVKVLPKDE
jgi:hypothetical protein